MAETLDNDLAKEILKRADALEGDRVNWETHWEEVAERVWPNYATSFESRGSTTKGEKRTEKMVDATAANALIRFSSAMESMLTPRNAKWHLLRPSDPYLLKDRATRLWFEQATDILFKYRYAPYANFASQNNEIFMGLGAFGTAAMFIDELQSPLHGKGLRYKAIHLSEVCFCENHQGIIDTAYRKFKLTARQSAQKFGEDALPDGIKSALKDKPDQEFEFVHCVKPRDDYDAERFDAKGKPFASYYVSKTGQKMMAEGGYSTFPYAISRYTTAPGETYGRSPAMMALPSIKVLNEEKATVLKQGHRAVDPVYLLHDDGVLDGFSTKPGAFNYGGVSAEGRPLVHTLPVGNIAVGKDLMDDERMVINDFFLVTLFQILVDTPQMTATEVIERAREKGALLSPTMGRQMSEYLAPGIEREVDVLARLRVFPPMPPALIEAQGEYEIQYDSPLSRMQKAEETAGAMRLFQTVTEIAAQTQDPSALDWFDVDVMVPELADNMAVPVRWIRDKNAVASIRDGRSQQVAAQQVTQALPGMAAMVKATQGQQ